MDMVNDMPNNERGSQRNFILFSAIPIALCIAFSLFYNASNPDTGLTVLGFGLILTYLVCPLYLAILCCYCAVKKTLRLGSCALVCLLMNAITNLTLIIMMGIFTGWSIDLVLWLLPSCVFSMVVMGVFLFIVILIKRRHDRRNISR